MILRKLSLFYLNNMTIPALLTSKKLRKHRLREHLIVRRLLLESILCKGSE
jgi:hypothetical protein